MGLSFEEAQACMDMLTQKLGVKRRISDSDMLAYMAGQPFDRARFLDFVKLWCQSISANTTDKDCESHTKRHKALLELAKGPPAIIDLDDAFLGVIMDTGHPSLDFLRQAYECADTKPDASRGMLRRFAMEFNVDRYMIEAAFRHFDKEGDGTLEREEVISLVVLGLGIYWSLCRQTVARYRYRRLGQNFTQ